MPGSEGRYCTCVSRLRPLQTIASILWFNGEDDAVALTVPWAGAA
jgi:hypothetical protein